MANKFPHGVRSSNASAAFFVAVRVETVASVSTLDASADAAAEGVGGGAAPASVAKEGMDESIEPCSSLSECDKTAWSLWSAREREESGGRERGARGG